MLKQMNMIYLNKKKAINDFKQNVFKYEHKPEEDNPLTDEINQKREEYLGGKPAATTTPEP